jgi:hypothetical protein
MGNRSEGGGLMLHDHEMFHGELSRTPHSARLTVEAVPSRYTALLMGQVLKGKRIPVSISPPLDLFTTPSKLLVTPSQFPSVRRIEYSPAGKYGPGVSLPAEARSKGKFNNREFELAIILAKSRSFPVGPSRSSQRMSVKGLPADPKEDLASSRRSPHGPMLEGLSTTITGFDFGESKV